MHPSLYWVQAVNNSLGVSAATAAVAVVAVGAVAVAVAVFVVAAATTVFGNCQFMASCLPLGVSPRGSNHGS